MDQITKLNSTCSAYPNLGNFTVCVECPVESERNGLIVQQQLIWKGGEG